MPAVAVASRVTVGLAGVVFSMPAISDAPSGGTADGFTNFGLTITEETLSRRCTDYGMRN